METERNRLLAAVKLLCKVAPKNIAALNAVKLSSNKGLIVAATDVEHYATIRLPLNGGGEKLEALLPAQGFLKVVQACGSEALTLAVDGTTVKVGETAFVGLDPTEFPPPPQPEGVVVAELGAAELSAGLQEVEFAAVRKATRHSLASVLLDANPPDVTVVASDGKRLLARRLHEAETRRKAKAILNLKTVSCLKALARLEPETRFCLYMKPERDENGSERETYEPLIHFVSENAQLSTRTADGIYPDWEKVIPEYDSKPGWRIGREALQKGLKTLAATCPKEIPTVRFSFNVAGLELYTKTPEVGESKAKVPAESVGEKQNPLRVYLNPLLLVDYLNSLPRDVEAVTFRWSGNLYSPTVWTTEEKGKLYVLMPLTSSPA